MIERYSRPKMKALWTEEAKYNAWAEVEKAHLNALVQAQEASPEVLKAFETALKKKSPADFIKREQETGHDVIAFVAEVGDAMGKEGSFLHKGLTSSDVVDTGLSLRILKSIDIITDILQSLRECLTQKSFEYSVTPCIGRTHGIHAEPIAFGQVLASHFAEFQRAHLEILDARKVISYGKLSGAVGTYSQITPAFEYAVLTELNLQPETVATQVIPRDRILKVGCALLAVSNAVERFALNIRHLARTEIGEVQEPFGKKQKGSSAMPHKKNPILTENLCGLTRTVRGYTQMLSENGALWHERDISHSSVERIALPDLFVTVDFMLARCQNLIADLQVSPQAMFANLWKTGGLWASQSILTALVSKGMNRTEAYELVQEIALKISAQVHVGVVKQKQFLDELSQNKKVTSTIDAKTLSSFFEVEKYLQSSAVTFKRVFGLTCEEYERLNKVPLSSKVPVLQKIVKVTVSLLPDVLDTEAKTIANKMKQASHNIIDLRQERSFIIRIPADENPLVNSLNVEKIKQYAATVLHNSVMENFQVEVIQ